MQSMLYLWVSCALVLACGDTSSAAAGGGPPAAGGAGHDGAGGSAGAVSSGGGPADPNACLEQEDESSCLELGCRFAPAKLFETLVCSEAVDINTCVWWEDNGGFLEGLAWKRETDAGLVTIVLDRTPIGFEQCPDTIDTGNDPQNCQCL